ncbi:MAG: NAD(P)/FAD-dependent oxidoreductase [Gammaproteobacteria bacterium]|nr:NAD(P)/FAD-dependent oxidoreductase [Gammaproteobacteria bacterium]
MKTRTADYPLVIVGAGAAGLGASEEAARLQVSHLVLEASHRTGGRGLTEYLEGRYPVDLGCHWMHSASRNPYVHWADQYGFEYQREPYHFAMYFQGEWLDPEKNQEYETFVKGFYSSVYDLYRQNPGCSLMEAMDGSSEWAPFLSYYLSLMHSNDVDQVSLADVVEDQDTGEDWPLRDGYGALIARQGRDRPVRLNSPVHQVNWSGKPVRLETGRGTLTAESVLITVSTGVLEANQIRFHPALPAVKLEAVHALPLGNHNYQFFSIHPGMFEEVPENIHYSNGDQSAALRIRPFGMPCLFTSTAGRFAWWLEKQGPEASRDYLTGVLTDLFGGTVTRELRDFKVSAWGYDPWIRGAYSSMKPGCFGMRETLAETVGGCLYFAGEATFPDFVNTAHGAYLSGKRAVREFYHH